MNVPINLRNNATAAIVAIVTLVLMLAFSPGNGPLVFAEAKLQQHTLVNQADQLNAGLFRNHGTFSLDQSFAPVLPPIGSPGIGNRSEMSFRGPRDVELGDGTAGGPAIPSFSGAAIILDESFDRPDSSVVGAGWVEVEEAGASAVIAANQLFFADASDVTNRPLVRRSFAPVSSGTLQWGFDFDWARTGNEGTYRLLMQLGDGGGMSDASQDGGAGINLVWTRIDGAHQSLGYRKDGADTALAVLSGPAAISVTADLDAETYTVLVDNLVVGTDMPFDASVSLDTVRFWHQSGLKAVADRLDERQKDTVSQGAQSSDAGAPLASAALKRRAPSRCRARPCCRHSESNLMGPPPNAIPQYGVRDAGRPGAASGACLDPRSGGVGAIATPARRSCRGAGGQSLCGNRCRSSRH